MKFVPLPPFPNRLSPTRIRVKPWHEMPMQMRTTIAETFIIHMIRLHGCVNGVGCPSHILHKAHELLITQLVESCRVAWIKDEETITAKPLITKQIQG